MRRYTKMVVLLSGFVFGMIIPVAADEISQLKEKIQAIQEENRLLQERLKIQEALMQELVRRLEELERKETEALVIEEKPPFLAVMSKMEVKGFADIGFRAEKADNRADENPSTFTLGEVDFFITSKISEKVSFFNENVIEFGSNQSSEIDLERLYLKYEISDLLNITLGRIHTPLGYWNTVFHHGKWFQLTHSRPLVMEYEHDNGIMPLHMVGIGLSGKKEFGLFELEYNFDIGNGRASQPNRVQNIQDGNDAKAFNSLLTLKPHNIPGLKFGFNSYIDKIPRLSGTANREGEIDELILGGYFAYQKDNYELLLEGFQINHDDEVSQRDYDTVGLYLQTSFKLKEKYTPYYRFDFLDFAQEDPYYSGINIDNKKHTLGLRWDLFTWNALKLEYSYSDKKNASDRHTITLNDSFHF